MIYSRGSRLVALALVLATLALALVAFGTLAPNPAEGRYPDTTDLVGHEAQYVGEHVIVAGPVVETEPLVVAADYRIVRDGAFQSGTIRVTVTDTLTRAKLGERAQVYGVLTDDRTVRATNTRMSTGDRRYMYLASFPAGLWVSTRLGRWWRLDPTRLAVVPREDPLPVRSLLTAWLTSPKEEDPDA